jgi:hypothetical protein
MIDGPVSIKCRKCASTFQPDPKTRGAWLCPSCLAKNPNLKRHYRSVADLCILGLIFTVILAAVRLNEHGVDLGLILSSAHAVLLLLTIMFVYKSKAPWKDAPARTLIWVVFGLALLFNVLVPLLFAGLLFIPAIIVYAIIFPYLVWLNSQANKCTAQEPPPMPLEEQS